MITARTSERRIVFSLLVLTVLNCMFQIAWFWRFRAHNVTMDGVNYIGLARHLLDGNWIASLHGYWSPLLSWLIAAGWFGIHDFTLLARGITIASYLVCLPLLYLLTLRLWNSRVVAAAAVLWFSLARGVLAGSISTIQADFLLTAATLLYFTALIACLRLNRGRNWFFLGCAHAIAFLAKAFAMPWLSIATALAILFKPRQTVRDRSVALVLALFAPVVVWFGWGEALKTRYGAFTTGFQLRANLMVDLKRYTNNLSVGDSYPVVDTNYDQYMVTQPDFATLQKFKVTNPILVPMILKNEAHNVPAALKELIILLTPGGIIALLTGMYLLFRHLRTFPSEAAFMGVVTVSVATLIGAYCMLVFDARYVTPITAVLIAWAARFIVPVRGNANPEIHPAPFIPKLNLALLAGTIVALLFYKASPFRVVDRDFQSSCYDATSKLNGLRLPGDDLVSVGNGPYPERGVGFEAPVYVAYYSGRRLIAMNSALPDPSEIDALAEVVRSKKSNAVLVWGKPSDPAYRTLVAKLQATSTSNQPVTDRVIGEVGRLLAFSQH